MAHNLMLLLENDLRTKEGIFNLPEQKRRLFRREKESEKIERHSELWEFRDWLHRCTQRGVKFIRWLRSQLAHRTSWKQSCEALSLLYARL